ncbi:hypothetical protein GCM10023195_03500 [Actinoallomurus liliacearum]|uniref:Uncharacterized protein n=1 Tax=Actinoallomurus liliacearum TaxID=1080073 RepID=A0ABP8T9B4_9ACTN
MSIAPDTGNATRSRHTGARRLKRRTRACDAAAGRHPAAGVGRPGIGEDGGGRGGPWGGGRGLEVRSVPTSCHRAIYGIAQEIKSFSS